MTPENRSLIGVIWSRASTNATTKSSTKSSTGVRIGSLSMGPDGHWVALDVATFSWSKLSE
jgi:hypothetical protein